MQKSAKARLVFLAAIMVAAMPLAGSAAAEDGAVVDLTPKSEKSLVDGALDGVSEMPVVGGEDRYVIGFYALPEDREAYAGNPVIRVNDAINFMVVTTNNPVSLELAAKQDPNVRYIEWDPVRAGALLMVPNDALYGDAGHYGSKIIGAESAWDRTTGSTNVVVGHIDSGLNKDHEEFVNSGRVLQGYDFVNNDNEPEDEKGGALFGCGYHGTHSTGTHGASINNGVGIAGIAQSTILPIKALGGGGSCGATETGLANALTYAADQGAHFTSNSWRWPDTTSVLLDAIDYADANGVMIISAAGNNGPCTDCVENPWAFRPGKVMITASSDSNDAQSSFSSEGPEVDIIAPGSDITSSTASPDGYSTYSGTSMAAPHVTGTAALIKALEPTWGTAEITNQLKTTTVDIGLNAEEQGSGRLNADSATSGLGGSDGGTTNSPPTASFTYTCTDLTCDFDGSGSTDSDGTISSYAWDFGDGNTGSGATVTHTYGASGDYTVTLTVTDDAGATDTDSQLVSVSDGSSGGGGDTMHVHDIDHYRKGKNVYIDFWVYDSSETAVSGATVNVEVCDATNTCATGSGTTDSNGFLEFRWRGAGSGTYTSCVTGLTHDTLTWDNTADHAGSGSCETESV